MSLCCPLTFFLKKRLQQNHNLSKIVVPSYKDFLNIINSMSVKHHVITFKTQSLIKYLRLGTYSLVSFFNLPDIREYPKALAEY